MVCGHASCAFAEIIFMRLCRTNPVAQRIECTRLPNVATGHCFSRVCDQDLDCAVQFCVPHLLLKSVLLFLLSVGGQVDGFGKNCCGKKTKLCFIVTWRRWGKN